MSDAQVSTIKPNPLPIWARALIVFVVSATLAMLAGAVTTLVFIKGTFEHCQEPPFIAKIAGQIAQFPDPLPPGYSYIFGADLKMAKIIFIDYQNGKQQFSIIEVPQDSDEQAQTTPVANLVGGDGNSQTEADRSLDRLYELGVTTPTVQTRFQNMIARGSWLIQGVPIPYRLGTLADNHGKGLVACILSKTSKKQIVFYAVQPSGKDFDMKICTNFLQDIKGF